MQQMLVYLLSISQSIKIYIASLKNPYSEVLLTQAKWKSSLQQLVKLRTGTCGRCQTNRKALHCGQRTSVPGSLSTPSPHTNLALPNIHRYIHSTYTQTFIHPFIHALLRHWSFLARSRSSMVPCVGVLTQAVDLRLVTESEKTFFHVKCLIVT